MSETVGSMNVEYTITVDQAIKNLDKINSNITKNEDKFNKQTKANIKGNDKVAKSMKGLSMIGVAAASVITIAFAAITAGLALIVGGMYGVMKASSYSTIYMKQFGATTQQIANWIMAETGLNTAIESLHESYQEFADDLETRGFWVSLGKQILKLTGLMDNELFNSLMKSDGAFGKFLAKIGEGKYWEAAKGLLNDFKNWMITKIKSAVAWSLNKWEEFKDKLMEVGWINDVIVGFNTLKEELKTKLSDMLTDFGEWVTDIIGEKNVGRLIKGFELIKGVWVSIKKKVVEAFDVIKEKIEGIIDLINDMISAYNRALGARTGYIPNIKGGRLGGPDYDEPGGSHGGTYPSSQFGGYVKETGLRLIHAGEHIVPKNGTLISSGGGSTYNISTNVNVAPGTSRNMADEISREVSRAIANEIKRIAKV